MLESFRSSNFEYKKLTEEEQQKRGILARIVGPIADYKNPTRNGRKYPEKLWEKVFSDPIVKEKIENKSLYGELGHPEDRLDTDMSKICICLAEQPKKSDDGKLYGVFDVLDTPNGRILKTLLDYGTTIGVSSRGEGDLMTDYNGEEVVDPDTYQFECWDAVILPAVKAARVNLVTESLQKKNLKQALREQLAKSTNPDKQIMNETLQSLDIDLNDSINESEMINEGIQYKGYDMTITRSGVQLRKSDGSFVQEFPTEQEAREYIDEMNESLNEGRDFDWKQSDLYAVVKPDGTFAGNPCLSYEEARDVANQEDDRHIYKLTFEESLEPGKPSDSSIQDVDIQKENETAGADNDGSNLVVELQETLQKNADLTKLVKALQEKLSVCYAKEKRFEGQLGTYKASIQSLQEQAKKASTLEGRVEQLQEQYKTCTEDITTKQKQIDSLQESIKTLKEDHNSKISSAKEVVSDLTAKVQSLQEELDSTKKSKTASVKVLKETYEKRQSALNEQVSTVQKDSEQKIKQLQEKLNKATDVATKYQNIAKKAVDRYITEKTNALGISSADVKSRLGKSYSFGDIDRICESLSTSRLAVNKLPFKVSQVSEIKVTETQKPSINFDDGDYIDPQLQGLVDRLH